MNVGDGTSQFEPMAQDWGLLNSAIPFLGPTMAMCRKDFQEQDGRKDSAQLETLVNLGLTETVRSDQEKGVSHNCLVLQMCIC